MVYVNTDFHLDEQNNKIRESVRVTNSQWECGVMDLSTRSLMCYFVESLHGLKLFVVQWQKRQSLPLVTTEFLRPVMTVNSSQKIPVVSSDLILNRNRPIRKRIKSLRQFFLLWLRPLNKKCLNTKIKLYNPSPSDTKRLQR